MSVSSISPRCAQPSTRRLVSSKGAVEGVGALAVIPASGVDSDTGKGQIRFQSLHDRLLQRPLMARKSWPWLAFRTTARRM
jgi:hypothetical protein